jgi:cysteine synthase B
MLKLTQEQYNRIVAHGLEGKPLEICGLLTGIRENGEAIVMGVHPVDSADKSELTYSMDPLAYSKIERQARQDGQEILGIYHTHPATTPYPSKTDVERAHWDGTNDLLFPGYSYLIVSLRDPARPEPRSYQIRGRRMPEDIFEEIVSISDPTDAWRANHLYLNGLPSPLAARDAVSEMNRRATEGSGILELIGNTPLIRMTHITRHLKHVKVYGKAEYMNPAGSVKDRAAYNMVRRGIESGQFTKDKTLLDSTSGNTGIAYAMIGAALGYRIKLVMPGNVSPERRAIVKMYGAETVLSNALEGSDGAILKAREIYNENPDAYFKPDQYNNDANPEAHYNGTGPEIWEQTSGKVTHFLATLGTSGTLMGTGRFLKDTNPNIRIIAVEPDNPMHGIEGLKHMASSIKPGIYNEQIHDEKIPASTEDAYDMQERLAREEGIFVGFSAGAAVWAALKVAEELDAKGEEAVVVTILCDRGDRYLTQLAQMAL